MKEQMGAMVQNPMTRDEALQILNIEEEETDPTGPEHIMKRFDILMEKNTSTTGGSFYIQSKIYFAKEHLMQDYEPQFNMSKFNPEGPTKIKVEEEQDEVPEAEVVDEAAKKAEEKADKKK